MLDELNMTIDIPIGYWECFQQMLLEYEIYADHQAKAAVDTWFNTVLT